MSKANAKNKETATSDTSEINVKISRVSKVVKGGRRFSFNSLVVAGNRSGSVGFGLGKALEVPDAIRKASEQAKRSMKKINTFGSTIPHEVVGKFGPTRVILKPASPGTGVIAGAAVRAVVEAAGITDIRTKCIGSNNAHNVLYAVMDGLTSLRTAEEVAQMRFKELDSLDYKPY